VTGGEEVEATVDIYHSLIFFGPLASHHLVELAGVIAMSMST
jgi:hypothetical protein